ncbi:hypothetical protein GCM10009830_45940 [Glycomyces endophyticus]|uniref:PE domain-containing protein n=1 Tax=Glycomyces endophyticus TaxID=480996 RepID=A0ABN2HTI1_9ACTN
MPDLQIDPEALDRSGQTIEATAEKFFTAVDTFASSIEGVTAACGTDEIGGLIEQAHTAVFEFAKECFTEAAQSMADAGVDVRDFAKTHLDGDDAVSQAFNQIASSIGGGA